MYDVLTPAEKSLARADQTEAVNHIRHLFQQTMEADFREAVERLTGRRVLAFISRNHIDPDIAPELFIGRATVKPAPWPIGLAALMNEPPPRRNGGATTGTMPGKARMERAARRVKVICAREALAKVAPAQRLDNEFARVKSPGRLALLSLFGERRCSIEAESAAASTDPCCRHGRSPPTTKRCAFMSSIEDQVASPRAAPFLNCPRCGLSIRPKARWMAVEHCPRCLVRARVAVKMFSSPLPAVELYEEGHTPEADGRGAPTTNRSGSR
jgi:Na+-translocating membrane potential-generating system (MpsC)